jgi:phage-related protein
VSYAVSIQSCYSYPVDITLLDSVEELLESLPAAELAKVLRVIDLLEEFGPNLAMPHSRHMSGGLLELRIRGKREIRIFYCFKDTKAYLLHGVIKKSQKTLSRDIAKARKAMKGLAKI